jgi:hypothetical protein
MRPRHQTQAQYRRSAPETETLFWRRPFARGVWESQTTPVSTYRGEVLDGIAFRTGGEPLDIARAQALYEDLERTPFVSVYASLMVVEDLAELVAWWQMTEKHGQHYRIEVRDEGRVIYSYEPMQSPLVRSRLDQLARFSSPETGAATGTERSR